METILGIFGALAIFVIVFIAVPAFLTSLPENLSLNVTSVIIVGIVSYTSKRKTEDTLLFMFITSVVVYICLKFINYRKEKKEIENSKCQHGVIHGKNKLLCGLCKEENENLLAQQQENHEKERLMAEETLRIKKIGQEYNSVKKKMFEEIRNRQLSKIEFIRKISPYEFESIIGKVFSSLGFNVEQTPCTGDAGKDLILRKDDSLYIVECKKYAKTTTIGRPDIQKFHSAIIDSDAKQGFFVNLGKYSKEAKEYANKHNIVLYDSKDVAKWLQRLFEDKNNKLQITVVCRVCGEKVYFIENETSKTNCKTGHEVLNYYDKIYKDVYSSLSV